MDDDDQRAELAATIKRLTDLYNKHQGWDKQSLYILSGSILVFGTVALVLIAFLINKKHNQTTILRNIVVPTIVILSVLLIVAGYGQEQISPVIGLFGTIVGYLLGKTDSKNGPAGKS